MVGNGGIGGDLRVKGGRARVKTIFTRITFHGVAVSRAVTSGAPPSTLRDLPTFVATYVHSSPPSASFAPNLAHLEATILKQGQDIANLSTRLAKLHAKLLSFCNFLAKEGE